MEIMVEGTGREYIVPDEVNMNFTFVTKGNSYEEVLKKGVENVEKFIETILKKYGFSTSNLKTKNFIIKEDTKYNEQTRNYDFDGYSYTQNTSLKFDYNKEKMAYLIDEIASLEYPPIYQICFGVKDKNIWRNKVIALAYQDAKKQAYAIALAAGKTLKDCVKTDFKPFYTGKYTSRSLFNEEIGYEKMVGSNANMITNIFTPEDIEITETLYCLWITE